MPDPTDLDLPKLTELFKSNTETINTLWTLLSTVALAMLGFLYKDGEPRGKTPLKVMLTIAFIMFAGGNCTAIYRHQKMLHAISMALQNAKSNYHSVLATFTAVSPCKLACVQILFSLAVVALVWLPAWLTQKKA